MKKLTTLLSILMIGAITVFAKGPKPKLFPEVEAFYASLSSTTIPTAHEKGIENLGKYILQGMGTDKPINLVFSDKDNSFVSQAAQIVLSSLLSSNKYNKLRLFSCGNDVANIHPVLLKVLSKHGYKVAEGTAVNGRASYNVIAVEKIPAINIFSKQASDASVSQERCFQLKMCSSDGAGCTELKNAFFKEDLSFITPAVGISEEEADKLFSQIAAEIVKAFNQAKLVVEGK